MPPTDDKTEESPPTPLKGLWKVMSADLTERDSVSDEPTADELTKQQTDAEQSSTDNADAVGETARPKGLWSIMSQGKGQSTSSPDFDSAARQSTEISAPQRRKSLAKSSRRARISVRASQCLLLGVLTVFLSSLALFPEFWMALPSLVTGLCTLWWGITAAHDMRRSQRRVAGMWLVVAGVMLGMTGILLSLLVLPHFFHAPIPDTIF